MRVLVACEFSGVVREAFRRRGHDAWSCDLLRSETENQKYHYRGDVTTILKGMYTWSREKGRELHPWDLMIAHPPCTYLASSGLHWNKRVPGRQEETEKALDFVRTLLAAPIRRICVENPVGCISTQIRKPDQYIQPWEFGHDASKKTGLWLKNLPLLTPTNIIRKGRYSNQTPTGQNNLGPSPDRWKQRSVTYEGIAEAFAEQWGNLDG